jgi:hypothetical protein
VESQFTSVQAQFTGMKSHSTGIPNLFTTPEKRPKAGQ